MAVRNFSDLGENLKEFVERLLQNQNLCKLLLYTDANPLNHVDIVNPKVQLLGKNIKVLPKKDSQDNTESSVVLVYTNGTVQDNSDFKNIRLEIFVYCPFEKWIINADQLRIFYIMEEIQKSLDGKKVKGLGTLKLLGFELDVLTDDMGSYIMDFVFDAFN